jgi:predicted glycosyltransferase
VTDRLRVLVDVTHPAHVHLFRNAVDALETRGHEVRVAAREKDVTTDLLDAHGLDYAVCSAKRSGPLALPREWAFREVSLYRYARQFRPDVVLSHLNPASAHVAAAVGAESVVFHDTEVAGAVERVTLPFVDAVCTPTEFSRDLPGDHVRYAGFHELAYLHPARFEPDPGVLARNGVDPESSFSVVRLVSMDAHHDVGTEGFDRETVRRLVDGLAEHGDVYLSTEGALPEAFAAHALPVESHELLDLLAFADCYVGDSGTMATEAGVLGTPAVRYDPLDAEMGNFAALADYGLVESTTDESAALERAVELAADPDANRRWARRRRTLLADKVDVTAFTVALAEEVAGS